MIVKTEEQRKGVIEAGRHLGEVLEQLAAETRAGMTTLEVDAIAERLIRAKGDLPAFKGYRPEGAPRPYPSALCISVNDEVVHGIPGSRILKEGDVVSLDLGLIHDGYVMDSALTISLGPVSKEVTLLMEATDRALQAGIAAARPGARIGDISHAIETAYKGTKFSIVKVLGGHGVGEEVHEEPFVPNAGHPGTGPEIEVGMVLALEPIANIGRASVFIAPDGYTYRSKDGSVSAHFEHTIMVDTDETRILTKRPSE